MLPIALLWIFSAVVFASDGDVRLNGEVSRGEEFRKDIAPGLIFALVPDDDNGWVIRVSTKERPSDPECEDFVWVVTEPYRGGNPRYLDTAYGRKAAEAVKDSPRDFQFVLSCADFHREKHWVDRVLWPGNFTDKEVEEAEAKLGSSPLGKGRLTILDAKVSPAKQTVEGVNLGQIDWIKFEVTITLPVKAAK